MAVLTREAIVKRQAERGVEPALLCASPLRGRLLDPLGEADRWDVLW